MGSIYCIKNKINKKQYIGQSTNVNKRIKSHINSLRNNSHHNQYLQNSWNKYGEKNFEITILEENCPDELLDYFERYYISTWKTMDSKYGYNLESGGNKNKRLSEKTRKKLSEIHKGENNYFYGKKRPQHSELMKKMMLGENNPMFNKKHSEETRKKMSQSHKGKNCGKDNPNFKITILMIINKNNIII